MNKYAEYSKASDIRANRNANFDKYLDSEVKNNMHYLVNGCSVNATKAKAKGEYPWKDWSYERINNRCEKILLERGYSSQEVSLAINLINNESLPYIRGNILKITHRHHEGPFKACIPFYVVEPTWLIKFVNILKTNKETMLNNIN